MERFTEEEFCKFSYNEAVAKTKLFMDSGHAEDAFVALEFIVKNFQNVETEIKEVLEDLRKLLSKQKITNNPLTQLPKTIKFENIGNEEIYQNNLIVLNKKFPEVANAISKINIPSEFSYKKNQDGTIIIYFKNIALSNFEKPQRAAEVWAEQSVNSQKFVKAKELLISGFVPFFHLEAVAKKISKTLHVYENSLSGLKIALSIYDCRSLLERISSFHLDSTSIRNQLSEKIKAEEIELFIYPQAKVLNQEGLDELNRTIVTLRGFNQIRPGIAVVGPMYGGSLPIAQYTTRALLLQKQRAFGYDMSPFYKGYKAASDIFKTQGRKDTVESRYLEMLSDVVIEGINERPVDIFICLAQAPISPKALKEIRSRGIITAIWFVEDAYRFETWKYLAPYIDYWFVIQKDTMKMIKEAGASRVIYLPLACDPNIHKPVMLTPEERMRYGSDISFVGAGYNNRTNMFASLVERDFKIWGTEWPDCMPFTKLVQERGRRLDPDEYVKIFNASTINLNLHSSSERDGVEPNGDFVNPRTFELAASGAFQLVDERSLMSELFDVKNELAVFHDRKEMFDQIDYFLARPEERFNIIQASRKKVLAEHTYQHRVQQMLEYIYQDKFEQLKAKQEEGSWHRTLKAAKQYPELEKSLESIYLSNEEPNFSSLAEKVIAKKGALSEHDQKILFLHHLYTQVATIEGTKNGSK